MLGKDPSTFGSFSVSGQTVTGTANKITGFEQFSDNQDEQEGYYYGFAVDPWEDSQLRTSRNPERWAEFKDDGNAVIFLGKDSPSETKWYEVKDAAGTVLRYTLNVTAAQTIGLSDLTPTLKKSELKAIAAQEGVKLPEHVTKAQIMAAIEEARDGLRDGG